MNSAYEVIEHLVGKNPNIECLTLVTYVEGPNWRDLPRTDEGGDILFRLDGIHQDRGERILTAIPRAGISAEKLRDISQRLGDNKLLGIVSKVRLASGGSAHIPMMDFACTASRTSVDALTRLLGNLGGGQGYLLESGRSYHYYGCQLLTEEEWKVFLGKCLLMSGFADDRYIGHQLVDGYCVLRLSSGKSKFRVPTVIAELS